MDSVARQLEGITSPCSLLIGQYPHHMTLLPSGFLWRKMNSSIASFPDVLALDGIKIWEFAMCSYRHTSDGTVSCSTRSEIWLLCSLVESDFPICKGRNPGNCWGFEAQWRHNNLCRLSLGFTCKLCTKKSKFPLAIIIIPHVTILSPKKCNDAFPLVSYLFQYHNYLELHFM